MGERLAMRATSMSAAALLVAAAVLAAVSMRFIVTPEGEWGPPPIVIGPPPRPPEEPPRVRQPPRTIISAPTPTLNPDESLPAEPTPLPIPEPPVSNVGSSQGAGPRITPADFIVRPNGSDFGDFYPDRALARNKQGRVLVRCSVNAAGRLVSCGVLEEEPAGWGFGNASRRLAEQKFVVRPQTVNGQPTDGGTITFPIRWRQPEG